MIYDDNKRNNQNYNQIFAQDIENMEEYILGSKIDCVLNKIISCLEQEPNIINVYKTFTLVLDFNKFNFISFDAMNGLLRNSSLNNNFCFSNG